MKKYVAILVISLILLCSCGKAYECECTPTEVERIYIPFVEEPFLTDEQIDRLEFERMIAEHQDDAIQWGIDDSHIGRLYIPSVDIDVGLGYSKDIWRWQGICDQHDMACMFSWADGHWIIADHNNQEFAALPDVQIGDMAYIFYGDSYDTLKCIDIFNGHNSGEYGLCDDEYNNIEAKYDIFCYTCLDWWYNIRIVVFEYCWEVVQ